MEVGNVYYCCLLIRNLRLREAGLFIQDDPDSWRTGVKSSESAWHSFGK